jgi:hypothetical protein
VKICNNCGMSIEESTLFCAGCGTQLPKSKSRTKLFIIAGTTLAVVAIGVALFVIKTNVRFSPAYKSLSSLCAVVERIDAPITTPDEASDYADQIRSFLLQAREEDEPRAKPFQMIPSDLDSYRKSVQDFAEAESMRQIQADPWGFLTSGPVIRQTVVLPTYITDTSVDIKARAIKVCEPYLAK